MNIYVSDPIHSKGLITLLKAFYPFESFELADYEQSTFVFVIKTDQISVAYFNEKKLTLNKSLSKIELTAIGALEGKAKNHLINVKLRAYTYDLLSDLTGICLPWGILVGIRPTKLGLMYYKRLGDYKRVEAKLCETYRVSPEKAALLTEVLRREEPFLSHNPEDHSVYIGVPFCPSKCSYCTFPSYRADKWPEAYASYTEALIQEMEAGKEWFRTCTSVYIGGGTPTSLLEADFDQLIEKVRALIGERDIEWTVEAGRPDSITQLKLESMLKYGVTRISINPQTMQNHTLEIIGRHHDSESIVDCFQMARDMGFEHINMDLILGLPGEGIEDVKSTFDQILDLGPESITVHTLAFKRGSQLSEEMEKYLIKGIDDLQTSIDFVQKTMSEHLYSPYYLYRQKQMVGQLENVGYCKMGCEGAYNIRSMEEVESIVAFGAGGISKRVNGHKIKRLEQPKDVKTYLEKLTTIIRNKEEFFDVIIEKGQ